MREYNRLPNGEVETVIPIRLKYDGHKTVLTLPEDAPPEHRAEAMNPMQKALVQGLRFRDKLEAGEASSISDLARREGMERIFLYHSLELANLAPDIIRAIVDGDVPDGFTLKRLRHGIPDDWIEQQREFGFPSPIKRRNRRFLSEISFFFAKMVSKWALLHYIILCTRGIRLRFIIQPRSFQQFKSSCFICHIADA